MQAVSFKRHGVPAGRHPAGRLAGWRYSRFNLSLRDVEEMPAQRGTEASYETVRCWTLKIRPGLRTDPAAIQTQADRSLAPG